MLSFVFAALVALLDQLFKRWVTIKLVNIGDTMELIPGVLRLTHWRNTGIALGMFDDFDNIQWPLVGATLLCVAILVFILLRYNEGFWGTLGLSAVLGGAVGNLIDRIFRGGGVVDMFQLQFVNFAIFNIADIFITLGAITFIVFFIISSIAEAKEAYADPNQEQIEQTENIINLYDIQHQRQVAVSDPTQDMKPILVLRPERYPADPAEMPPEPPEVVTLTKEDLQPTEISLDDIPDQIPAQVPEQEPEPELSSLLGDLGSLEKELAQASELDDIDMDELLREYGFESE